LIHLKPCMSRIRGLRVTTDVLLSVVAQNFALVVFIYLCAGEYLPPSGDADEGWLPTGTYWCRSSEEAHTLLGQRVCAYHER
jgi:hypothetical protein